MIRRRPAAAADDRDVVALDELAEHLRDLLGGLGEDGLAVRALERQARVRDAVHRQRRALAEEADRVAHVLGTGRAVEPDHVDFQRLERRQHRLDVGAQQHLAALRQQRDRGLDRQRATGLLEGLAGAEDGGLDLEDVLRRLDDDQVGAARHQAPGLLGEHVDELAERDPAEGRVVGGRQEAGGPDRPGDEALRARGPAGDLRRLRVDLQRVLAEAPLVELDPRALEGVGLEHLGAGIEHRGVHALDHVGTIEHQGLVALALEPAVVLAREVELLQRRAHAAVEDDDAFAYRGEKVSVCGCQSSHLHRSRLSHRALLRGVRWLRRLLRSGSLSRSRWSAKDSGVRREYGASTAAHLRSLRSAIGVSRSQPLRPVAGAPRRRRGRANACPAR